MEAQKKDMERREGYGVPVTAPEAIHHSMKAISKVAVTDPGACNACGLCAKLCPVEAISLGEKLALTDPALCRACTICVTRCPRKARALEEREEPLLLDLEVHGDFAPEDVEAICNKAHMYPEQVVCYCYRTTAGDIAKAILAGARSPEDVSRMTGARTGCGVLCITGILRLLQAAAVELKKAPGFQWYGKMAVLWDVPQSVIDKYGAEYYIEADRAAADKLFPGGDGNER